MKTKSLPNTAGAIWSRILNPGSKAWTPTEARGILKLEFAEEDLQRARELAAKAREGDLTPSEQAEVREYERADNILSMMKSKARLRLKRGTQANGSAH